MLIICEPAAYAIRLRGGNVGVLEPAKVTNFMAAFLQAECKLAANAGEACGDVQTVCLEEDTQVVFLKYLPAMFVE